MAYANWENIFNGDATRIKKALYGSFLVRDYDYANTGLQSYSPFDPVTGNLSTTLLTTDGWHDIGLVDENGVQFNPKYTTTDTMAWQSRMAQRTDCTLDQEECSVTAIEQTPLVDELNYQLAIGSLPRLGTIGYQVTKPVTPQMIERQVLAIGVDGSTGHAEYFGTMYARSLMTKPDKYDYQAKTEVQTQLTWDSFPCPYSGFAVRRFREGPAWRAAGGTTATPGTPVAAAVAGLKATLTFVPPASDNGPFTYQVTKTISSVTTTVSPGDITVTSASPSSVVLTVANVGTASAAATFRVLATGSNGSQSAPSTASNSVTLLA